MSQEKDKGLAKVIPLTGKDEMNLVEIPYGPVSPNGTKTYEIEHERWDPEQKRYVTTSLVITGSDKYGLPKPIDDSVLIGLTSLTAQSDYNSRKIWFSAYQLFKLLGWPDDGRSYKRLEASLDRIVGTSLKCKDYWYDNEEKEYKSHHFHLIEAYSLCSRNQIDRARKSGRRGKELRLWSFTWSEQMWKSFRDGYIRTLDMEMYRKISKGRRREVALRLYRVIAKRIYHNKRSCSFDLERLCVGILGLSKDCPSHLERTLRRNADWLIECGCIQRMDVRPCEKTGRPKVYFYKRWSHNPNPPKKPKEENETSNDFLAWFDGLPKDTADRALDAALSHAATHHPDVYESYQAIENRSSNSARKYLEIMLEKVVRTKLKSTAA